MALPSHFKIANKVALMLVYDLEVIKHMRHLYSNQLQKNKMKNFNLTLGKSSSLTQKFRRLMMSFIISTM